MIRSVPASRPAMTVTSPRAGLTSEQLAQVDLSRALMISAFAAPLPGGVHAVVNVELPDGTPLQIYAKIIRATATTPASFETNLQDTASQDAVPLSEVQKAQIRPILANRMDLPAILVAVMAIDGKA